MAQALAAAAAAIGQVGSTAITDLFQNKVLKAQAQQIITQTDLSVLTQQQQAALNQQLANASTDTARMQILTNAVAQIEMSQNQTASGGNMTEAIVIVCVGVGLVIIAIVVKKFVFK